MEPLDCWRRAWKLSLSAARALARPAPRLVPAMLTRVSTRVKENRGRTSKRKAAKNTTVRERTEGTKTSLVLGGTGIRMKSTELVFLGFNICYFLMILVSIWSVFFILALHILVCTVLQNDTTYFQYSGKLHIVVKNISVVAIILLFLLLHNTSLSVDTWNFKIHKTEDPLFSVVNYTIFVHIFLHDMKVIHNLFNFLTFRKIYRRPFLEL